MSLVYDVEPLGFNQPVCLQGFGNCQYIYHYNLSFMIIVKNNIIKLQLYYTQVLFLDLYFFVLWVQSTKQE